MDILFSIGGKYFTGEPITYSAVKDNIFEQPKNITIKLHHRVGKFVKLRLHFADAWIMISEISFDSGKCYLYFIENEYRIINLLKIVNTVRNLKLYGKISKLFL